jgi:transcriptional regulator with XRE-family HTH domain
MDNGTDNAPMNTSAPDRAEAGWLLRAFRITSGHTQEKLAKALGIDRVNVSLMELGNSVIPIEHMRKIQETLNLSDAQLNELNNLAAPFRFRTDREIRALEAKWLNQQPSEKRAGLLLMAFRVRSMASRQSFADNLDDVSWRQIYEWENGNNAIPNKKIQAIQAKIGLTDQEVAQLKELSAMCRQFYAAQRLGMKAGSTQVGAAAPLANHTELALDSSAKIQR